MKKMYICVKESIPSHKCLAVAHGVLMAHFKFQPEPDYQDWLTNSFHKVVCEVSDEEFESLKTESNFVTVTESALDGIETSLVFCPREVWPKKFKFFPLLYV